MANVREQAKLMVLMVFVGAVLMWMVRVAFDIFASLAKLAVILLVLYLLYLAAGGNLASWNDVQEAVIKGLVFVRHIWRTFIDSRPEE